MSKYHWTRGYRIWRAKIIRRDKRCVICGSIKNRRAHHKNSVKFFPKQKNWKNNGVTLCYKHHKMFHLDYMGGFKKKCTKYDFNRFVKLMKKAL